ncbi:hypothetical protein Vretimale_3027 [Volvox reticuliferus]|uniref:N-alpha-acetyltransferase 40 n=1 Tax=Volvox reticuliferus TaxID=1737510 RepID=A0A8J4CEV3_9CHLO|nr:hypothetical protein Vretifemale_6802 [Volvox reticuliferus]GIL97375.1 hypothetical protein Vretimale_3027 [Volvox reticuliferus]
MQVAAIHAAFNYPGILLEVHLTDACVPGYRRENMASLYDRVWTWSDTKKRKQLTSAASRFLIAHEAGAARTPLAYVNYRFEEDEGYAVLYCYELQVVRAAQSRGLGRLLMELAEQIAWGAGMSKLMLTVFSENTPAVAFYQKLGYELDETSPDYCPSGGHSIVGPGSSSSAGGSISGAGGSSNLGGLSSGTGTTGRASSSLCSFNGCSGSQTDSAGGGCGYYIMSKRAPAIRPQQEPAERQPPSASQHNGGPAQQELWNRGQKREGHRGHAEAVKTELESNKRQRTNGSGPHNSAVETWDLPQTCDASAPQQLHLLSKRS